MWTLLCNIPIARRRTLCFVLDDAGDLKWSGKSVGAALLWLHENDQDTVELHGVEADERFHVHFITVSTTEPPEA